MSSSGAALQVGRIGLARTRRRIFRPWPLLTAVLVATILLLLVSTYVHLEVPAPTGQFAVGRERVSWVDGARPEPNTPLASDHREVPALVWYPALAGSGEPAAYVPGLSRIRDSLVESGEVSSLEATGLRYIRDPARAGAQISPAQETYPVVVLSPGNLTNVSFYASLAEDLASHGYIVVGVDHPYSVAAVELSDGSVAVAGSAGLTPEMVAVDTDRRVEDIRFVLDRITGRDGALSFLDGKADLDRVGVMGHSLGGVAAAEVCSADARVAACLNIDGQQEGGPFSTERDGAAPEQAFMYLTKEVDLHPVLVDKFEAAGRDAFMAVIPAAAHEHFADGPLFEPSLIPWDRTADDVIGAARGIILRFFDHSLRGEPVEHLGDAEPPTDVFLNVFPLGDKEPLPS